MRGMTFFRKDDGYYGDDEYLIEKKSGFFKLLDIKTLSKFKQISNYENRRKNKKNGE